MKNAPDRIELMQTFVRIVEAGSLSAAALQMGATQPTVSRRLQALERSLGRIAGVNEMTSSSSLGSTRIILEFKFDRDINGAARDVQWTRQNAFGVHSSLNSSVHNVPNGSKASIDFFFAAHRQFVLHHQAGNRQPVALAQFQQFAGGMKIVGHVCFNIMHLPKLLLFNDKTTADGVISFA